jgi:hypothetical protein
MSKKTAFDTTDEKMSREAAAENAAPKRFTLRREVVRRYHNGVSSTLRAGQSAEICATCKKSTK